MSRIDRIALLAGLLGITACLCLPVGCRSEQRKTEVQSAAPSGEPEPVDAMAGSDADRAEAAIERDRQERAGQRRPFDPGRERAVDQPRVGGGRR